MQRRSFIKSLLTLAIAPHYLPGAGRLWKATLEPSPSFVFDPVAYIGNWTWIRIKGCDENGMIIFERVPIRT